MRRSSEGSSGSRGNGEKIWVVCSKKSEGVSSKVVSRLILWASSIIDWESEMGV